MLILWHLPPLNQHINTLTFYGFPMEGFHAFKSCIGIGAAGFCCARICFSTIVFRWNKPLSFQKLGYWEGQKQSFQCKHFPKCCPPPHNRKWQNISLQELVTIHFSFRNDRKSLHTIKICGYKDQFDYSKLLIIRVTYVQ